MRSPLSGQHQNNLIDYFKMFERFRWVDFLFSFSVLVPHPLFCCETLYRSGIQLPLKVPQSSHDLISAPLQFQFASAGAERLVSVMWLKDAPVRMKTCMPPPAVCCFIKRVRRQTVQSQIDCAAPLHWLRRLLLSHQVCVTKKYTQGETQLQQKLWFHLIFILLFIKRLENLFFFINFMDYLLIVH